MLELFLTTLVILLSLLGFFYLFGTFKIIQTFLYVCQLIFAIVLVNIALYKKNILMYDLVTYVHNITFNAINKLELVDNNTYLQMKYEPNLSYSTINYSNYSNECLDNYFISNSTCPITDIKLGNISTSTKNGTFNSNLNTPIISNSKLDNFSKTDNT